MSATTKQEALKQLEELRSAVEQTIQELEGKVQDRQREVDELKHAMQGAHDEVAALKVENDRLNQDMISMRKRMDTYARLTDVLRSLRTEMDKLEQLRAVPSAAERS